MRRRGEGPVGQAGYHTSAFASDDAARPSSAPGLHQGHHHNTHTNAHGTGRAYGRRAPSPIAILPGANGPVARASMVSPSARAHYSTIAATLVRDTGGPSSVSVVRPPRAKFIPLPESLTRPSTVLEAEDEGETSEYDAHLYQGTSHLSGWETQDEERRVLLGADVTSISRQASTEYVPPAGTVSTDQAALVAVRSKPEPGGRLTTVCLSDALDRQALEAVLRHHEPGCQFATYADVLHVHTPFGEVHRGGDCFFFDYGVVVLWGLSCTQEAALLATVTKHCSFTVLSHIEQQLDELAVVYSSAAPPNISNDTITIDKRQAADPQVKLAISHALAQCGKLSLYEDRIMSLVDQVRHLPKEMADKGTVSLSRSQVARLMGEVFIQKSDVNLLSTVLGVPEFFWRAPDSLQTLYERVKDYMDMSARLALLNARFEFLQRMLDIWRDHANHYHLARLDVIIVVLIVLEVIMAGAEVVGFFFKL